MHSVTNQVSATALLRAHSPRLRAACVAPWLSCPVFSAQGRSSAYMHLPLSARCGPLPAFGSQGSTATSSPRSPTLLATKVRGLRLAPGITRPRPPPRPPLALQPRLPNDSLALTLTLTLALTLIRRAPWACRRTRWRRRLRSSSGARGRGGRGGARRRCAAWPYAYP